MNMSGNRHGRQSGTTEGLDKVNQELLRASWEVDFLTRAASAEQALTAPDENALKSS